MPENDKQHYQQKLAAIQARNLSGWQRSHALLLSASSWTVLYLLITRIQYIWVPFVIEIQKFSHLFNGYVTYLCAALFFLIWFYFIYRFFQFGLIYLQRCMSGVREKSKK